MAICEYTQIECEHCNAVECDPPECLILDPADCPANDEEDIAAIREWQRRQTAADEIDGD